MVESMIHVGLHDLKADDAADKYEITLSNLGEESVTHPLREWRERLNTTDPDLLHQIEDCVRERDGARRGFEEAKASPIMGHQPENLKTRNPIDLLIEEASEEGIEIFADQFKMAFAAIQRDGHRETLSISDSLFAYWLRYIHYKRNLRGALNSDVLKNATEELKARAIFSGRTIELSQRVAWLNGELWYDLGNEDWNAVRIHPSIVPHGWEVVANPPILFRRSPFMESQVMPEPGGSWDGFLDLLNLPMDKYGTLIRSHLIHLFIPGHPRPYLDIFNRKGAGKTDTGTMVRKMVDPVSVPDQSLEDRDRNINNILDDNYLPFFDNVVEIPDALRAKLCRTNTGESASERLLHSNRAQVGYKYMRTALFTSIQPLALEDPDLVQRFVYLNAPFIPDDQRREKKEMQAAFEANRAKALGFIFTAIAKAMAIKDELKITNLPRMADYAAWGEVISRALDEPEGAFLVEYRLNLEEGVCATLDANPLAQAIIQYFHRDGVTEYIGTAEPLFDELVCIAGQKSIDIRSKAIQKNWPGGPNALTRKLPTIADDLRGFGIHYHNLQYKDLPEKLKKEVGDLASNRSIIILVKRESIFYPYLPGEKLRKGPERFLNNTVKRTQQVRVDRKNDIVSFSSFLLGRIPDGQEQAIKLAKEAVKELFASKGKGKLTIAEIGMALIPASEDPLGDEEDARGRAMAWFKAACQQHWLPFNVSADGTVTGTA